MRDLWQNTFICLGNWGYIKILLLLLLITVALPLCFYVKARTINPIKIWKNLRPGERNEIIRIIAAYVLILLASRLPGKPIQILSFLTKPAEVFLTAEPLIWSVEAFLTVGSILVKGSKREYLNTVNVGARILIFVSVASTILILQVPLCCYNILWFLAVGALHICLKLLSMVQPSTVTTKDGLYEPISRYDDLFPPRQKQADELCRIIGEESSSRISICVAGPWGSGKTSLVLGAWEKLRKNSATSGYEYIFLHAMELDSLSSLFSYLFLRIREILKVRGAYVGPGSEYRRLIASAGGLITSSQLSSVLERKLFYEEDDYRSQRERLEATMEKVLQKDKLVIVVDDIERCDPEKAREFLYFVKEIATMKCCISIFITDDKYLPVPTHIEREKEIFFDKFFNFRMVVAPLSLKDIMESYEEKMIPKKTMKTLCLNSPKTVYLELRERLLHRAEPIKIQHQESIEEQQKEEEEEKQRQAYLLQCIDRLTESLSRPRTLVKFYVEYGIILEQIQNAYEIPKKKLPQEFVETLKMSELTFLLAYLKICFEKEYNEIKKSGFQPYLEQVRTSKDENKRFLGKVMQDTLFQDYIILNSYTYHNNKRIQFLDTYLDDPAKLPNVVSKFIDEEKEWLSLIEQNNSEEMEKHWMGMLSLVVNKYSGLDKNIAYLERLIQFAEHQVMCGSWDVNIPLQVFEYIDSNTMNMFGGCHIAPLASLIDKKFSDQSMLKGISKRTVNVLERNVKHYFYYHKKAVWDLVLCIMPRKYAEIDKIRDNHKCSSDDDFNYVNQIRAFVSDISQFDLLEKGMLVNYSGLDGLDCLLDNIKRLLKISNCMNYPDVHNMFEYASEALKELKALSHLLDQCRQLTLHESVENEMLNMMNRGLKDVIAYMKIVLQEPGNHTCNEIKKMMMMGFDYLDRLNVEDISQDELESLHDIVTKYGGSQGNDSFESLSSVFHFRSEVLKMEKRFQNGCDFKEHSENVL